MKKAIGIMAACLTALPLLFAQGAEEEPSDLQFLPDGCTFSPTGDNPYFPLQPGHRLVLKGEEDGEMVEVVWEVLHETRAFTLDVEIGAVESTFHTAIVQETESVNGEWVEISRNYFAQCLETGTVFYFGEDVDDYQDGEIVGHEGAWLAGENGNVPGVIMPGAFVVGDAYFQEFAPGVAEDAAMNVGRGESFQTPAGDFGDVAIVEETDPLELDAEPSLKRYAPGIGLIHDDGLELVEYSIPSGIALDVKRAVRISWPSVEGDFVLESAGQVEGPWLEVNALILDVEGGKEAWAAADSDFKFYRLRRR